MAACEVEYSDEFERWYESLTADEQESVKYSVDLLEAVGVALGHPHTSQVYGSKHGNMRELRIQHRGRPYRVLYAFDPRRMAILLIGGDKGSQGNRWYDLFVPLADSIYDEHLATIQREQRVRDG